jgi:hypothetical protein
LTLVAMYRWSAPSNFSFGLVGAYAPRFLSNAELWFHRQVSKDLSVTPLIGYDLLQGTERPTWLTGSLSDVRQVGGA